MMDQSWSSIIYKLYLSRITLLLILLIIHLLLLIDDFFISIPMLLRYMILPKIYVKNENNSQMKTTN